MYVCICKNVTEKQIHQLCCSRICTLRDLREELGVGSQCGRCAKVARQLLHQSSEPECIPHIAAIKVAKTLSFS